MKDGKILMEIFGIISTMKALIGFKGLIEQN
jgi:hypothetical protein